MKKLAPLALALSLAAPLSAQVVPEITGRELCDQIAPDTAGAVAYLRCLVREAEKDRAHMAEQLQAAELERAAARALINRLSEQMEDLALEIVILRRSIEGQQ